MPPLHPTMRKIAILILPWALAACSLIQPSNRVFGPTSYLEHVGVQTQLLQPQAGDAVGAYVIKYRDSADEAARRQARNDLVGALIAGIDTNYEQFLDDTYLTRGTWATLLDVGALGLASSAVLTTHKATSELLAALSAGFVATKSVVDLNWYYEQTIPILIQKMERLRASELTSIRAKLAASTTEWPLSFAVGDVNSYYLAGTWTKALSELLNQEAPALPTLGDVTLKDHTLTLSAPGRSKERVYLLFEHAKGFAACAVSLDAAGTGQVDLPSVSLQGELKFTVVVPILGISRSFDLTPPPAAPSGPGTGTNTPTGTGTGTGGTGTGTDTGNGAAPGTGASPGPGNGAGTGTDINMGLACKRPAHSPYRGGGAMHSEPTA